MAIGGKPTFDLRARPSLFDVSLLGVIFGNLVAVVLAVIQDWNMGELMWVYWGQSVIIGATNVARMLSLKEFTTKGMKINDAPVSETRAAKIQVATFFTIHYGFFHFVYAIFLWQELALNTLASEDRIFLVFCIVAFLMSHTYSLRYNRVSDFRDKKPNLATLMFYPYLRIIPMHLAILLGSIVGEGRLFLFMGLKMFADAATHMIEHSLFRGSGRTAESAAWPE